MFISPGRDARLIPSIKFVGTHLYTWVERGTESYFSGLEPGPLELEAGALTMRPLRPFRLTLY